MKKVGLKIGREREKNIKITELRAVWPDKNRQMSVKVASKWFHYKNDRF